MTTIPLNDKQRARLTETEKRVTELRPHWESAVSTHGAVIGSLLDAHDIDAASVTDVKVTADGLVVTVKEPPVREVPHPDVHVAGSDF